MRRLFGPAVGLGCLLALVLSCFGPVLFRGEQFGYRDAAHFYYPLYQRVQEVWREGRLPLWDARENAGMPLLGNPTAAVLYPGKLVYAVLPYPWAARAYIILHTLLAVAGMYLLLRNWEASRAGSLIAGLSYGFGAPILFQYCNVIYLVGAAWVPFALRAVDRLLRSGRRGAIAELALILAMQVLGGDPQSSYLVGLCAGGYAVGLAVARRMAESGRSIPKTRIAVGLIVLGIAWVGVSLGCAWFLPRFRAVRFPPKPLPWTSAIPTVVLAAWIASAVALVVTWRRRPRARVLLRMLAGLGLAAVLGGVLSAAQLLPVLEFTRMTERAGEDGTHDIYPFSLEPYRVVEFVWPGIFGSNGQNNHSWHALIPPVHRMEFWVPSLYLGGLTIILALATWGFRDAPRAWLSTIALVGLVASFGEFGSPLWAARNVPEIAGLVGPHDPLETGPIRRDFRLRDGEGGLYSIMALTLPGFGSFRYPSKLLTFVAAGLAGLAGLGWDEAVARRSRRAVKLASALFLVSAAALVAFRINQAAILGAFRARAEVARSGAFGPFDPVASRDDTRFALLAGTISLAATAGLLGWVARSRRAPKAAGTLAVVVLAADLIVANSGLIATVPQSYFEGKPEVLRAIEEAEARDPSPGPFRIHRMPAWSPAYWSSAASPDRIRDMVEWERKTIQPKYGLPLGVSYTLAEGVGELYDYKWFFAPFHGNRVHREGPVDDSNPRYVYYPRRGFDMWNSRYFVLPAQNANDEQRAISSFLLETEPVMPRADQVEGAGNKKFHDDWMMREDWRLVRNKNVYPRAWVVHDAEILAPIVGLRGSAVRERVMEDLLYQGDPLWTRAGRSVQDPSRKAWVEVEYDEGVALARSLSHLDPESSEAPRVTVLEDERVVIEAELASTGLVILADVYYPGWEATLDGRPAPILRANRLMRGMACPPGKHVIEYRYRPKSVPVGMALSAIGLVGIVATGAWASRRPMPLV